MLLKTKYFVERSPPRAKQKTRAKHERASMRARGDLFGGPRATRRRCRMDAPRDQPRLNPLFPATGSAQ